MMPQMYSYITFSDLVLSVKAMLTTVIVTYQNRFPGKGFGIFYFGRPIPVQKAIKKVSE